MEARIFSLSLIVAVIFSCGANYSTRNFVVRAPDPRLAREVGELAEKYRRELAIRWLGHELPTWTEKCPILVQLEMHAGGETSFAFVQSLKIC